MTRKTCVACFKPWAQGGAPDFAEFCEECFAKVQKGKCPVGYAHMTYLAPPGLYAEWPVVVCGDGFRNPRPFSDVHTDVRRADVLKVLAGNLEDARR